MVAPKSETQMIAQTNEKMVRMIANRDCMDHKKMIHTPGKEFETTEEQAKILEKPIQGHYSFFGTRPGTNVERYSYQRAKRL